MSRAPLNAADVLVVGKLTGVYGVKGWIKVHSFTEPADNIFDYQPWYLSDAEGKATPEAIKLVDWRAHGKGYVAQIEGISDRDQAALLNQRLICVDRALLPELPEDEFYWEQLQGLRVLSQVDETQAPVLLGVVHELLETGANDVLSVVPCEGSIDQRSRLLPYADEYIVEVDLAAGEILVDWDPEF